MVRIDWQDELKNPGSDVHGVVQNVAYLFYNFFRCEYAEENWQNACSAFLRYASKNSFGIGNGEFKVPYVSLERATTNTLNFSAFCNHKRGLSSPSQEWDKAVRDLARKIFDFS